MKPMRLCVITITLCFLAAFACDSRESAVTCSEAWPSVPLIAADPDKSSESHRIQLEEIWRAGGSTQGQELAAPASVTLSATGFTAIVDHRLAEVVVVSPQGRWLGTWGQRGRGPGELTMPVAANWRADTLLVFDIEQAKVTSYAFGSPVGTDLTVAPEFLMPVLMSGEISYVAVEADGSVVMKYPITKPAAGTDTAELVLMRLQAHAAAADTLIRTRTRVITAGGGLLITQPGAAEPLVAIGPDGWAALAAADGTYRVLIRGPNGVPSHQICRDVPPIPLTNAEVGGEPRAGFEEPLAAIANAPPIDSPRAIGRMMVGPSGELWVQRTRPAPFTDEALYGVAGVTLDIYDRAGSFLGEVIVPSGVRLLAVADTMAIGVNFSELDEPVIIAYRVRS